MTIADAESRIFASPRDAFREGVQQWRDGQRGPAIALLEAVIGGGHGPVDRELARRVSARLLKYAPAAGWPKTEHLARQAAEAFPDDAFGWRHLGEALLQQDRFEEAEAPLLRAIEVDPDEDEARLLLLLARRRLNPAAGEMKGRTRPWPDRRQLFQDPRRLLERYLLKGYPERPFVGPDTVFMTLGSCFAENLARCLAAQGRRVHSEPIGEEVNSTYANRLLLKWVEAGAVDGPTRIVDEVYGPRRRERLRQALRSSDVLVLTLGVAPCFFDRDTGEFAFTALGSAASHQYLANRCVMRTTTVAENVANIHEIVRSAERIAGRPHQVVLTVSPVALAGTTEFYSAVVADCLSKSTLRLAVHEAVQQRPDLVYWPSFEIVRWLGVHYTAEAAPVFGAEDGSTRHVSNWLVELIVQLFLERHGIRAAS